MMVKSILLDQNAKEWEVEIQSMSGFISACIDEKTQNIKVYYIHDDEEESQMARVIDCGTNQECSLSESDYWVFIGSLPQHDGHIVHHLFWLWK